jgi:hypothetical protein
MTVRGRHNSGLTGGPINGRQLSEAVIDVATAPEMPPIEELPLEAGPDAAPEALASLDEPPIDRAAHIADSGWVNRADKRLPSRQFPAFHACCRYGNGRRWVGRFGTRRLCEQQRQNKNQLVRVVFDGSPPIARPRRTLLNAHGRHASGYTLPVFLPLFAVFFLVLDVGGGFG